ncbi:MAG: PhoH family protein [Thermodesulfobacteriota bacterium]
METRTQEEKAPVLLTLEDNEAARILFGERNANIVRVSDALGVKVHVRGNRVSVSGPDPEAVELSVNLLRQLYQLIRDGYPVYEADVDQAVTILSADHRAQLRDIFLDTVFLTAKKKPITPKSQAQKDYIEAMRRFDIVFGIGPAGTGKTYLAMAMAVSAFTKGLVNRIILTRPAVEAGEALGFLPGDLAEKVNPYLRPLYDALHDMVSFEKAGMWMQKGAIEVAPLAFMRGRTLNNAFIVLDEAQNTTSEQMKMFLTRIGFHSKAVITGDITQIDLPNSKGSGLVEVKDILADIEGIHFTYFSKRDVVRHRLVQDIIRAYEELEVRKAARKAAEREA